MKRFIKLAIFLSILVSFFFGLCSLSKAESSMQINSNQTTIEKGQEIDVTVSFHDTSIAALTIEIFFDNTKLEYVKGPKNSNYLDNRILYTWVAADGKGKNNFATDAFILKGTQNGIASIAVAGEFYGENGEKIDINNDNIEVQIGNSQELIQEMQGQSLTETEKQLEEEQVGSDNTNLKILRLNDEGMTPSFAKEIKDYYFVTAEDINSLEITAVPENKKATVKITGNQNLKMGNNTIAIEVTSEDKTKKAEYKIYVTKVNNLALANTNLETLAVRQGTLVPEFDNYMTQYRVDVANDIEKIDLLAIPESINATVTITGNDTLKIGDNLITITVLAEDKIAEKKYELNVHRRTEEEQKQSEEEQKIQIEKASAILEEKAKEQINKENEEMKNIEEAAREAETKTKLWVIVIVSIAVILSAGFYIFLKYNYKNV